jgi:phosphate:Na+ symporter
MNIQNIFLFIGGITLFIYGITLTSKSMEGFAFTEFKKFIDKITAKPIYALGLGAVFTSIVQSSSATTVTVISLANSGILRFENTLGIIFGANVGTTVTAQIIAFRLTRYGLIIFAVGFLLSFLVKKESVKAIGGAIMGFGLIFIGMKFMEASMAFMRESPYFVNLFIRLSEKPILGVLVAAGFTAIGQSSSVTIGIVQALGAQKLITLNAAFALVIGANIGTTITAVFASIGGNVQARRVAVSHIIFNVIGAVIFLIIFKPYVNLISRTSGDLVRQIANAHTFFNIICALSFIPFVSQLSKLIKKLVPGEALIIEGGVKYLDKRLLNMPSFAVDALFNEIVRMKGIVKKNLETFYLMVDRSKVKLAGEIKMREHAINNINREIQAFAPLLMQKKLSEEHSKKVNLMLNIASQLERIGDIVNGLSQLMVIKINNNIVFSPSAIKDLHTMMDVVKNEFELVEENFEKMDKKVFKKIGDIEQSIDDMEVQFRDAHVSRLLQGVCFPDAGIIYVDVLSDLERISDHIYKIARLLHEVTK